MAMYVNDHDVILSSESPRLKVSVKPVDVTAEWLVPRLLEVKNRNGELANRPAKLLMDTKRGPSL